MTTIPTRRWVREMLGEATLLTAADGGHGGLLDTAVGAVHEHLRVAAHAGVARRRRVVDEIVAIETGRRWELAGTSVRGTCHRRRWAGIEARRWWRRTVSDHDRRIGDLGVDDPLCGGIAASECQRHGRENSKHSEILQHRVPTAAETMVRTRMPRRTGGRTKNERRADHESLHERRRARMARGKRYVTVRRSEATLILALLLGFHLVDIVKPSGEFRSHAQ